MPELDKKTEFGEVTDSLEEKQTPENEEVHSQNIQMVQVENVLHEPFKLTQEIKVCCFFPK